MTPAAIAFDLGGTRIKLGVIAGGSILAESVIDAVSDKGLVARLPAIEAEVSRVVARAGKDPGQLAGVGISIPGIVDSERMTLLSVNEKYSDAVGFDFSGWAKEKWNLRLVVENDARAALAGEWQFGAGRGCANLVMLTLGTGIGGAAVIDGKLLRGKHFQAGILPGHFTVNFRGDICNCGNIGCVESEASTWRLPEMAGGNTLFRSSALSQLDRIEYKDVFTLAGKGDALAIELVEHSLDVWSSCVVNMIHAYDPELVIIGGGIMRSEEQILPGISSRVQKRAWTPWGKVRIVPAEQKDFAALLGISYLLSLN